MLNGARPHGSHTGRHADLALDLGVVLAGKPESNEDHSSERPEELARHGGAEGDDDHEAPEGAAPSEAGKRLEQPEAKLEPGQAF